MLVWCLMQKIFNTFFKCWHPFRMHLKYICIITHISILSCAKALQQTELQQFKYSDGPPPFSNFYVGTRVLFFLIHLIITHNGTCYGVFIYWISPPSTFLFPSPLKSTQATWSPTPFRESMEPHVIRRVRACIAYHASALLALHLHPSNLMWISQTFGLKRLL